MGAATQLSQQLSKRLVYRMIIWFANKLYESTVPHDRGKVMLIISCTAMFFRVTKVGGPGHLPLHLASE